MWRILAVSMLFSSVALADGSSTPPVATPNMHISWQVFVTDATGTHWFLPGKSAVELERSEPWTCTMRPLDPGSPAGKMALETVTVDCVTADAEIAFEKTCTRRRLPRTDVIGERRWRLGDIETHRLAPRGKRQEYFSISLSCSVDTRYEW